MVTLTSPTSTTLVAEWLVRTPTPTHTHTLTSTHTHTHLTPHTQPMSYCPPSLQPPVFSVATTSPQEAWFVILRDSNDVDFLTTFIISDPNTLTYTFTQLDKGSGYSVRVAGSNSQGIGDFSDFVSNQTLVDREYIVGCMIHYQLILLPSSFNAT